MASPPPVVLFGYDSSPFTQKVRMVLKVKQIPYTFVVVSSMMPRPVLRDNFHLTYRKIPVLAIGREIYCDTSIIIEALEHRFHHGYRSVYPLSADGRDYRPLMRGFASYWTDRPLFRVTTGLIPGSVWRTHFGVDRAELIGHKLDADKLAAKVPQSLSGLDLHLSILEPQFRSREGKWIFSAPTPSLADIALYYQLDWGNEIAAGHGIENLTGGGTRDTDTEGTKSVFNRTRYPSLYGWFEAMRKYLADLPSTETKTTSSDEALRSIREYRSPSFQPLLLPTTVEAHKELDEKLDLVQGAKVSIAPDDTGRADPTVGELVALSTEEVVIKPADLGKPTPMDIRIHFPRLGFVIKPQRATKL